jgi:hypothetical protein
LAGPPCTVAREAKCENRGRFRVPGSQSRHCITDTHTQVSGLQLRLGAAERGASGASSDHQRALARVHDEVAYSVGRQWQAKVDSLTDELRAAHVRVGALQADLAGLARRANWSPDAAAFAALERKVDDMDTEVRTREARWRSLTEENAALADATLDASTRRWEAALQAKASEVGRFKAQVDDLLVAVTRLQAA